MKFIKKYKNYLLFTILIVGFGLILWGNHIMVNYENFREIRKAAFNAASPQYITGFILMIVAYIITYIPRKK